MLVGSAGGAIRSGRFVQATPQPPITNLYVSMLACMGVDIDHPKIGPMKTIGLPLKSSGDLTAIRKPAPWLGQHTAEVLEELADRSGRGRAG